jgi:cob(I)alamin adenosyltransferase
VNAWMGMVVSACGTDAFGTRLRDIGTTIQSRLFDLGADLATPASASTSSRIARLDATHVAQAESWIDEIDGRNATLRAFVLPGGSELAARLHVARTVCRRAERLMVALARDDASINPLAIQWINRLSDLLFAMARLANKSAGVADVPWVAATPPTR